MSVPECMIYEAYRTSLLCLDRVVDDGDGASRILLQREFFGPPTGEDEDDGKVFS